MPLDTFNSFIVEKTNYCISNSAGDSIFYPNGSDSDWVAIPIMQEQLKNDLTIPYIVSFLTSNFFNGRINHVHKDTLPSGIPGQ